ncbi:hypothetical protein Cgig2_026382 [Carnegiea gigantea]|uniref:Uncharacterized protein n=1 Tax=Carnegiea gigantea TaxID=171969 RepID=A0A9Q1JTL6_9CARY|nr:hypothetical protein Cgig2_026382 [Carnegiea gigantea]
MEHGFAVLFIGVNEDDYFTTLPPQHSTDNSVGTQSADEVGREGESTIDYTTERSGSSNMNKKKKRCNFKPRGPNKCKKLANLKDGEKLELTYFYNGPVGGNHNLDKFKGKGFQLDREAAVDHMKRLWHYWRGSLVQNYIKLAGSYEKALEKGGKEGKMPTVAEIFKETRQLKSRSLDEESASKLEEIIQTSKDNPHISTFQLVEECFRPQHCDHVACFGYEMKPKGIRGPSPSRAAL